MVCPMSTKIEGKQRKTLTKWYWNGNFGEKQQIKRVWCAFGIDIQCSELVQPKSYETTTDINNNKVKL